MVELLPKLYWPISVPGVVDRGGCSEGETNGINNQPVEIGSTVFEVESERVVPMATTAVEHIETLGVGSPMVAASTLVVSARLVEERCRHRRSLGYLHLAIAG